MGLMLNGERDISALMGVNAGVTDVEHGQNGWILLN